MATKTKFRQRYEALLSLQEELQRDRLMNMSQNLFGDEVHHPEKTEQCDKMIAMCETLRMDYFEYCKRFEPSRVKGNIAKL